MLTRLSKFPKVFLIQKVLPRKNFMSVCTRNVCFANVLRANTKLQFILHYSRPFYQHWISFYAICKSSLSCLDSQQKVDKWAYYSVKQKTPKIQTLIIAPETYQMFSWPFIDYCGSPFFGLIGQSNRNNFYILFTLL